MVIIQVMIALIIYGFAQIVDAKMQAILAPVGAGRHDKDIEGRHPIEKIR